MFPECIAILSTFLDCFSRRCVLRRRFEVEIKVSRSHGGDKTAPTGCRRKRPSSRSAHMSARLSVHRSAPSRCSAIRCLNRSLNRVADVSPHRVKRPSLPDATALHLLPAFRRHHPHSGQVTLAHSRACPLIDSYLINGRALRCCC